MSNEVIKTSPFEITTFEQAERYAKMIAESDFAPNDYKGKPGNVMIAMQMGHELGLKPSQAIQNIAVVSGRPMVWGDAALALVRSNPEFSGIKEWMEGSIEKGDAICYCEVKRGNEITLGQFSIKQAIKAGLVGRNVWAQYPERMLKMRARGFALRDTFPDVLKGVYIEGEIDNVVITENEPQKKEQSKLGIDAVKQAVTQTIETVVEHIDQETGEVIIEPQQFNAPSFEEVKAQMEASKTVDDLILASDIARSLALAKEQRDELAKIYKEKQKEVKS